MLKKKESDPSEPFFLHRFGAEGFREAVPKSSEIYSESKWGSGDLSV
jgi:hypothetical protein